MEFDLNSGASGADVAELREEIARRCEVSASSLELRQDRGVSPTGSPVVSLGLRGASHFADADGHIFASTDVKNQQRVTLSDKDTPLMVPDGCRMCIFAMAH